MVKVLEVLGPCFPRTGHLASVEHTIVNHKLDDTRSTANVLDVFHDVFPTGLEVGQKWSFVRNPLKVFEGDIDLGITDGSTHGDQMKNGVGRSTGYHHNPNSVLKSSLCHDVTGFKVQFQKTFHCFASSSTFILLFLRISGRRTRVREGHSECLDGCGHGVSCVHTTTSTLSGTRMFDDLLSLLLSDLVVKMLSVRLKGAHDI
mmetsp:Transcript_23606/g.55930  ORF Transcript_23606/g.55930 Transcript_23606/m.55930 type:complete len:203 (+) Transcript_23606:900-1508(+)